jgi:large subunit ribosomal protein L24
MQTTKPSKQRKRVFQAPDHRRYRAFGALLSSNLKATHGIRTLPLRTGDTIRIMRGDHKGFEGKVSRVDREKYRVYVEGLTREKVDGSTVFVSIHPSKVMITNLMLDDKWRKKILARKKKARKEAEETAEKPLKKPPKEAVEEKKEVVSEKKVAEEKVPAEKSKAAKKRRVKKEATEKKAKASSEVTVEEKPKTKKPRAKRKTVKKTEGGT